MSIACVILAAGTSGRFGSDKLVYPLGDGTTLLQRTLEACARFPRVVVCSQALRPLVEARGVRAIVNERPDRGMAYSLQLADAVLARDWAIAVLPADLADLTSAHVARVVAALADADVAYPASSSGELGHPVVFSAHARVGIAGLAHGDTIRHLRDRSDLRRSVVTVSDPGPYRDVDRPSDLATSATRRP